MIRLANVLILDHNSHRADSMRDRLGRGGYHAVIVTAQDAVSIAHAEHPDLILIGDVVDGNSVDLAGRIKADPIINDIPVVVLTDHVNSELCSRVYDLGLDDVIAAGCDDTELYARIRPLVRLATMHSELRQRAKVARTFGVEARSKVDGMAAVPPSVLIIGDDSAPIQQILAQDAELVLCGTLFEAEDLLISRNFDAAVISFSAEVDGLLGFCSQVRNNPRLFNLPIILVAGMGTDLADAYRRGATRVLSRPTEAGILRCAVMTLVRRQQLRWNVRSALNDSLQAATRDAITGAYNRAFMEAHLASRIAIANEQNRHLAVVFFSAPNIDGVRRQFGDDAALHLTQQVGQWITGLLRAEDLTATYKTNEFCVILPDTPLHEAEVVMHRIAGVLAYTDFAVRDVYQPVKVWVQVGSTDVREKDSLDLLLSRARANLD